MDKRVLITGATGFVGSAVALALARRGLKLRLLVRPGSDRRNLAGIDAELAEGDLARPETLAAAVEGCGQIYHVAADYRLWVPDPEVMMRANVEGSVALFRAAHAAGVERAVYCSSVAALGLIGDGTVADETTKVDPAKIVGVYKQSKYRAEQAVMAVGRELGMAIVTVNPSTPVGPRDIKPTPTGVMIRDAAAGKMPAYVDTGLNIVHVDDVAEGHLLAMERGVPGEKYILGGEDMTLASLFRMVAAQAGVRGPYVKLSREVLWPVAVASEALARGFGIEPRVTREMLAMSRKKMFFSSAKAEAALGYRARPAAEAVRDAIDWFRAQGMIGARAA